MCPRLDSFLPEFQYLVSFVCQICVVNLNSNQSNTFNIHFFILLYFLRPLRTMGHSKEKLAQLPKYLDDGCYYFRKLPHYLISLTSLLENMAPKIDEKQLSTVSQPVCCCWAAGIPLRPRKREKASSPHFLMASFM